MVEAWPEQPGRVRDAVAEPELSNVAIGSTSWRPEVESSVVRGGYVSESPRAIEGPDEVHDAPAVIKRGRKTKPAPKVVPPQLRSPQRLPLRKPRPQLPEIDQGLTTGRSSAVVNSASTLPDWPTKAQAKDAFRKENMDVFTDKQSSALERQKKLAVPAHTKALKDNVVSSPDLSEATLPMPAMNKTVKLPSEAAEAPLTNSLRPVNKETKPSREASSKTQTKVDVEKAYVEWSTFDEPDGMDATALYNERGEALKRYDGEEP